jgi:sugar-specific transcriptional regulator TrmB
MNISEQIADEFKVLDDSANWLVKVASEAMAKLDSLEQEYSKAPTPENLQKIEQAIHNLETLLAKTNKELEISCPRRLKSHILS